MYEQLFEFRRRPAPFSRYTAPTLWTDPHISQRMLAYHLDPSHDIASRKPDEISRIASWIDAKVRLRNKAVCDLGCGPGHYAREFACRGAQVIGLDFSERSLAYARRHAETNRLNLEFRRADYTADPIPANQDLIVLIYGDICALSPQQRKTLYGKIREALVPGGKFILDAFSEARFAALTETTAFAHQLMNGFWSSEDYFGFSATLLYGELKLALDRYLIVEPERSFEVFNWIQYFTPEKLAGELADNGFEGIEYADAVSGGPWTDKEGMFALVATRND